MNGMRRREGERTLQKYFYSLATFFLSSKRPHEITGVTRFHSFIYSNFTFNKKTTVALLFFLFVSNGEAEMCVVVSKISVLFLLCLKMFFIWAEWKNVHRGFVFFYSDRKLQHNLTNL